jgi:hypothetical protein
VNLCSGCHADTHTLARMMRNPKKQGEVRSAVQNKFPQGDVQARCLELAQLVINSKVMSAEQLAADEYREIQIGLKLTKPYRNALHLIARDRKLSMANYTGKL